MKIIHFNSKIKVVNSIRTDWTIGAIEKEPQFFSSDIRFARDNGSFLTDEFLSALPSDWKDCDAVIDSRVHMLMPGWFPCIPGWHLDDVPRTREDGQPDHVSPQYQSEHILCIIGDASRTEFAVGQCDLEEPPIGKIVYGEWHTDLETILSMDNSPLERHSVNPGDLVQFDWQTWHRGTAATHSGWRWFIRISRNTTRKIHNKIRTQTQVYLPCVDMGW